MSFFNLFGKSKSSTPKEEPAPKPNATPEPQITPAGSVLQRVVEPVNAKRPEDTPSTVRVYDEFGRELQVPIETWRTSLLPAALENAQADPDKLYNLIVDGLQLRLAPDMLPSAEHLHAIDPTPERGTTIYGIVLMECGDPLAAETLFENYLRQHGPSGVVLTNLAKAQTALGKQAEADATLWRALEADPNQENGLGWYVATAVARDGGGDQAYVDAMKRVAELPTAWRPQVWLARTALEHKDMPQALSLYRQALERAGKPAPIVLLQSMSGDLGNAGHLREALALTRPAYDVKMHGLAVGNNLIKAALDLGEIDSARALVEELYQHNRPDWAAGLNFWESEIRRLELAARGKPLSEPKVTAFNIEGPVWLPSNAPSRTLFELSAPRRAKVVFLGSSVIGQQTQEFFVSQLADVPGRLSRALPLFLAESAFLHLGLDTDTIIPWIEHSGFAVVSIPWGIPEAIEYAHKMNAAAAISIDVHCTGPAAEVTLRIVRSEPQESAEPTAFAEFTVPFNLEQAGTSALGLWSQLANQLVKLFGDTPAATEPSRYALPANSGLAAYLLRLEQLLAVRCSGSENGKAALLNGVREIVRGELDLALSTPHSLPARLILHETLLRLRDLDPHIAAEFRHPAELLQQRYPLSDAQANAVLENQIQAIYGSNKTTAGVV
jgi:tetratricopeptide (TPR) repeat protein